MSKSYVIRWRSKENGRAGKGSRLFEKEEAETLAAELNSEYPEIEHQVVEAGDEPPAPANAEPASNQPQHALSE